MLVNKTVDKKKLAIYIAIMIVMFGGSVFLLIKNYRLNNTNSANYGAAIPSPDAPLPGNETALPAMTEEQPAPLAAGSAENVEYYETSLLNLNVARIKSNLSLLDEDNFALLRSFLPEATSSPFTIGKNDPFTPYE